MRETLLARLSLGDAADQMVLWAALLVGCGVHADAWRTGFAPPRRWVKASRTSGETVSRDETATESTATTTSTSGHACRSGPAAGDPKGQTAVDGFERNEERHGKKTRKKKNK